MSALIFENIKNAICEVRPELAEEFGKCERNKPSIVKFLDKHFPISSGLEGIELSWANALMTQVPDTLRRMKT